MYVAGIKQTLPWRQPLKRMMTLAVAAGLLSFFAGSACGQGPNQDDLIQRRDAKLAEDWITKAPWQLDYDVAREEAAKNGKLIFAYFTRSYSP